MTRTVAHSIVIASHRVSAAAAVRDNSAFSVALHANALMCCLIANRTIAQNRSVKRRRAHLAPRSAPLVAAFAGARVVGETRDGRRVGAAVAAGGAVALAERVLDEVVGAGVAVIASVPRGAEAAIRGHIVLVAAPATTLALNADDGVCVAIAVDGGCALLSALPPVKLVPAVAVKAVRRHIKMCGAERAVAVPAGRLHLAVPTIAARA